MRPFQLQNDPCVKCGYEKIEFAGIKYQIGIFDEPNQFHTTACISGGKPPDYLLRTCPCCGYCWAEAPLDAESNITTPL